MRLIHIITSLETGGAQSVLFQLLRQFQNMGVIQTVISLKPNGGLEEQIKGLNIPIHECQFRPFNFLQQRANLKKVIIEFKPDIIQSWLYHADFMTIFLRDKNKTPIFWGIHHTYETQSRIKFSTRMIIKVNSLFSNNVPQKIICCSRSALSSHLKIGFPESKLLFIPNGIDINSFKPDEQARERLRSELNLQPETQIIGYIARLHPQKDHDTFFKAADLLLKQNENIHFVLAGDQVTPFNPKIVRYMHNSQYPSHFHFLGRRSDIPMITAALDLATLTSSGDEAFPLTILEAMSCGIPCVSTNIGDVKETLGNAGIIVPPQNPEMLAAGWKAILDKNPEERSTIKVIGRNLVVSQYTNEHMAKLYFNEYKNSQNT
jgi:glycosyltransferase involved in cell wall biosynthesis